jgi:tRNA (adenine57-N1/adenine58-N1)-methyltransferase
VSLNSELPLIKAGDLVELVGLSHKYFIIKLNPGEQFQTHRGVLRHDDLIGKPWGSKVLSHIGNPFFLLQPALGDIIRETRRSTQILYPKDIGFILITMGIGPGQHILEAGTGSGAMTTALAFAVGPTGHVTTYEIRPDMQRLAIRNLTILGLDDRITFKLADIGDGFTEQHVDAAFMDVPNPEDYIHLVRQTVKIGGFFGCILPTANQISRLLPALRQQSFSFIEVCETYLRYYKPVSERLRPTDRMVAHTGYLVFARSILQDEADESIVQDVELE